MKKYFIKTYGCQMNEHDSEKISAILENIGYKQTISLEEADVFVINSCSVRQAAEDSVYGWGKKLKEIKSKPFVVLAGCLSGSATGERARISKDLILKKVPWVDILLPPNEIHTLPSILRHSGKRVLECDQNQLYIPYFHEDSGVVLRQRSGLPRMTSKIKHAWVTISTGCDNFCSYCVVPYARKEEVSRSKEEIMKEIKGLIKRGISEITLLGQNVNSWGLSKIEKKYIRALSKQKLPFADLLREICKIPNFVKIEFLSSNPFDFTEDLIDAIKNPKISRYLHIALQSGDDEILKKMNRRHTSKEYIKLISKIRKAVPDAIIGTDLIVGFPGETESQFKNTIALCKKVKFAKAYVAMYSPRPGTAAFFMKDEVMLAEKRRRHRELLTVVTQNSGRK